MYHWIPFAFVRITLCLCAGIVLAIHQPDLLPIGIVLVLTVVLTVLFVTAVLINRYRRRTMINPGAIGLTVIFLCGFSNVVLKTAIHPTYTDRADHFSMQDAITHYQAVAVSTAEEKEKTWKQVIRVKATCDGATWHSASGNVLVYFPKTSLPVPYAYGDVIVVRGAPVVVPGPSNPGEFDYRRFLSRRNIHHQHFTRDNGSAPYGYDPPSRLIALCSRIRSRADGVFETFIDGKEERAIARALVLGITDGLDNEITGAYAATGSMHVLAVSGLHVGILYMIAGFLLAPLKRIRSGKWLFALLCILMLWCYACVTGLSPSVMRAVTMFSFFAIAQPLKLRGNVFNTLAASAFCLLMVDPLLIMSVGFQLSYLAVAGIVYFHPLLYRLLEPESRIIDEIWRISCVSIAAQLATFPLGVFYFHQFPNYFLIANLFVIPLAFVILVGGLILLCISWIIPLAQGVGFIVEKIIAVLNFLIFRLESLPYAASTDLQITAFQCWMLLACVVVITLFFQFRKFGYFLAATMIAMSLSVSGWIDRYTHSGNVRFIVYRVPGITAFDLIDRDVALTFPRMDEAPDLRRTVQAAHLYHRVRLQEPVDLQTFVRPFRGGRLIVLKGETILHLESVPAFTDPVSVDYLILSRGAAVDLNTVFQKIHARKTILDGTYSYFVADKVLHSLPEQIQIHSVVHHGAFEANI